MNIKARKTAYALSASAIVFASAFAIQSISQSKADTESTAVHAAGWTDGGWSAADQAVSDWLVEHRAEVDCRFLQCRVRRNISSNRIDMYCLPS